MFTMQKELEMVNNVKEEDSSLDKEQLLIKHKNNMKNSK